MLKLMSWFDRQEIIQMLIQLDADVYIEVLFETVHCSFVFLFRSDYVYTKEKKWLCTFGLAVSSNVQTEVLNGTVELFPLASAVVF